MKKAFLMVAISLLLSLLMVGCSVSVTTEDVMHFDTYEHGAVAFAEDVVDFNLSESEAVASADDVISGTWDNLSWTLNETTGELVISGTGEMDTFTYYSTSAWRKHEYLIKSVTIKNGVTSIGDHAFYCCFYLTSVTIPSSVTSIGDDAFESCFDLTSITIPGSVTSIGSSAFLNCTGLTSITIPDSVTSIGSGAFRGCTSLTNITIPGSVTSMGNDAFYRCTSLTAINVDRNNTKYQSADGNLYSKDGKTLIQYAIGKTDTSFSIPNRVTSIGSDAFAYCSSLTSITIPGTVTSIGSYAFYSCTSLTNITIPSSVASIQGAAFQGCTSLTGITIRDGVTSIGNDAFYRCTSLTSITIPGSVTSIGSTAFKECTSLTAINVDVNNTKYKSVDGNLYSKTGTTLFIYANGKTNTSFAIPNRVTSIGDDAFAYCNRLTSITIPDGVTSIGEGAFLNCTGLTSITIPDSVTSIGEGAFGGCSNLESIDIPDKVTSIGSDAFDGCSNLISVTIGNSVTDIGYYAFQGCYKLVEVINHSTLQLTAGKGHKSDITDNALEVHTGESKLTEVDGFVFYPCDDVNYLVDYRGIATELILPTSFNGQNYEICESAFYSEDDITSITISDGVTTIPRSAFEGCSSLTNITIPASVTIIDGILTFDRCFALKIIYIKSPIIATELTSDTACGDLIDNAEVILIEESITSVATYVTDNFSYKEKLNYEGTDYVSYSKHKHTWEDCSVARIPCERDGFAGAQCTICDLLKGNTILAHNYIPHSAGDEDYHWDACDGCEKFINKVGHNYGEWIDAVEPSCEIAGSLAHYHCECGLDFDADKSVIDDVSIPATGHSFGEWVVSKEPTCTEAGEERRDCDNCDYYETNELPALEHDFSEGGRCAMCGKLSDGAIAGIAIGSSVAVTSTVGFSILGVVLKKKRLKKANK